MSVGDEWLSLSVGQERFVNHLKRSSFRLLKAMNLKHYTCNNLYSVVTTTIVRSSCMYYILHPWHFATSQSSISILRHECRSSVRELYGILQQHNCFKCCGNPMTHASCLLYTVLRIDSSVHLCIVLFVCLVSLSTMHHVSLHPSSIHGALKLYSKVSRSFLISDH